MKVDRYWMKSASYEVEVVFKNEPAATYFYFLNPTDNAIEDGGHSGNAVKHLQLDN